MQVLRPSEYICSCLGKVFCSFSFFLHFNIEVLICGGFVLFSILLLAKRRASVNDTA